MKHLLSFLAMISIFLLLGGCQEAQEVNKPLQKEPKLYWFIPDGMRADPDVFTIYQWAEEGKLPNIKKMMDNGAYGYSIPTFPSHTPTNFATLLTGAYPTRHGITDGPMHTEGNPLSKVSVGGFNSAAKKIDPIWVTLEQKYNKTIILLSIPGSTPPELEKGITIRGRWGGWGADFHATNFESGGNKSLRSQQGSGARLFFFGPPLTKYQETTPAKEWINPPVTYSKAKEVTLENYGAVVFARIYDSSDNSRVDYDRIAFSFDKKTIIADLEKGEWSDWLPLTLVWTIDNKTVPITTSFKIKVIKVEDDGFYRVRFFYNNLNKYITKPGNVADEIVAGVGPMVDFVDNFPPQLIFYTEDKETFIEEATMSLDWHKDAVTFILETYNPDIFINDIYTPNQMLTSRWWLGYIDPQSARYLDVSNTEREELWNEVQDMYIKLDAIIGEMLEHADNDTYIVLSSDHGAVPLDKSIQINNLFAQKGWLTFTINETTGESMVDWTHSTVIYLNMAHVYIHPKGLGGNWTRASGEEYEALRAEVKEVLLALKDPENGAQPVIAAYSWEEVPKYLDLPTDRVGDLVLVNKAGYGLSEKMSKDKEIFSTPLISGYKQAILAEKEKGTWTPFIIIGPGIKKGYQIEKPIHHVDQYPTIMTVLGKELGKDVDGEVINEILE